jgi:hypothetical protein
MKDMKQQDAGLVVTCVQPLYYPSANERNIRETIYTTFELRKFRIYETPLMASSLSVITKETAKQTHLIHEPNNATICLQKDQQMLKKVMDVLLIRSKFSTPTQLATRDGS